MGGSDKLATDIGGRPLLAWTLAAVAATSAVRRIVVVTTSERRAAIETADWLPAAVTDVVTGGGRRQESVHAGFLALEPGATDDDGVVLVHDGARPLVEASLIEAVIDATAATARRSRSCRSPRPSSGSISMGLVGTTVDRTGLGAAQTPQGVRRDVLREAFRRFPPSEPATFTDEASLLEAWSIAVHVVSGDPGNLKVTLPGDLGRAAAVLGRARERRTGIGHDSHPFGPDMGLRLGGIEIAAAPRLAGHSDGDVALHAIADALLGATGQGDLGPVRRFAHADGDRRTRAHRRGRCWVGQAVAPC